MIRRVLLLALASLAISGCDRIGSENGRGVAVPAVAPPTLSPVEIEPPHIDRSTVNRTVVKNPAAVPSIQTDVAVQSPGVVDILWVIDDSGSMADERQRLANSFDRFLAELNTAQVTYQIGVTSTNLVDHGVLRGTTPIITNSTPDGGSVFADNTTFGASRARWEQGLRMMQEALAGPATSLPDGGTWPNAQLVRPNAALAVIVVSDEDDNSFGDPAMYARWLRGFKGKGNENLVSFSTIAGTTPDGCFGPGEDQFFGGQSEPAFRYSAVSQRTGGVIGSVCDSSFENTLIQIAQALNTLRRIFPLSLSPDPSTIHVFINGSEVAASVVNGWLYNADTNSISFLGGYVPPPGAQIRIVYAIAS